MKFDVPPPVANKPSTSGVRVFTPKKLRRDPRIRVLPRFPGHYSPSGGLVQPVRSERLEGRNAAIAEVGRPTFNEDGLDTLLNYDDSYPKYSDDHKAGNEEPVFASAKVQRTRITNSLCISTAISSVAGRANLPEI